VPWNAATLALGLAGWAGGFVVTGLLVAPLLAGLQGVSLRELSTLQQTEYVALVQGIETVEGIAIIWLCVRSFDLDGLNLFNVDGCVVGMGTLLPPGWVLTPIQRSEPVSPPDGWLVWGILFYLTAFPVIGVSASVVEYVRQLFYQPPVPAGSGTVDAILPLVRSTSALATFSLAHCVSLSAPRSMKTPALCWHFSQ